MMNSTLVARVASSAKWLSLQGTPYAACERYFEEVKRAQVDRTAIAPLLAAMISDVRTTAARNILEESSILDIQSAFFCVKVAKYAVSLTTLHGEKTIDWDNVHIQPLLRCAIVALGRVGAECDFRIRRHFVHVSLHDLGNVVTAAGRALLTRRQWFNERLLLGLWTCLHTTFCSLSRAALSARRAKYLRMLRYASLGFLAMLHGSIFTPDPHPNAQLLSIICHQIVHDFYQGTAQNVLDKLLHSQTAKEKFSGSLEHDARKGRCRLRSIGAAAIILPKKELSTLAVLCLHELATSRNALIFEPRDAFALFETLTRLERGFAKENTLLNQLARQENSFIFTAMKRMCTQTLRALGFGSLCRRNPPLLGLVCSAKAPLMSGAMTELITVLLSEGLDQQPTSDVHPRMYVPALLLLRQAQSPTVNMFAPFVAELTLITYAIALRFAQPLVKGSVSPWMLVALRTMSGQDPITSVLCCSAFEKIGIADLARATTTNPSLDNPCLSYCLQAVRNIIKKRCMFPSLFHAASSLLRKRSSDLNSRPYYCVTLPVVRVVERVICRMLCHYAVRAPDVRRLLQNLYNDLNDRHGETTFLLLLRYCRRVLRRVSEPTLWVDRLWVLLHQKKGGEE